MHLYNEMKGDRERSLSIKPYCLDGLVSALLQAGSFWSRTTIQYLSLGVLCVIPVALEYNYLYIQSVWNYVRDILHSIRMLFLSSGTDVVCDVPWSALVAQDGVVLENCIVWRELKPIQSYALSSSVWSLLSIIPKASGNALEKTSLNSQDKT